MSASDHSTGNRCVARDGLACLAENVWASGGIATVGVEGLETPRLCRFGIIAAWILMGSLIVCLRFPGAHASVNRSAGDAKQLRQSFVATWTLAEAETRCKSSCRETPRIISAKSEVWVIER